MSSTKGGGSTTRRGSRNRNVKRVSKYARLDAEVVDLTSPEKDQPVTVLRSDNQLEGGENNNPDPPSSSNLLFSSDSSGALFNSAAEDWDEEGDDEDDEEGDRSSVVNASLLVNLSNANVSCKVEEEGGAQLNNTVEGQHIVESSSDNDTVEEDAVVGVSEQVETAGKKTGSSSSESTTLADSEVANLMSHPQEQDKAVVDVPPVPPSLQLPSTVTCLTAQNGVKVYLVGTAHFSQQSQVDVVQTIEKTHPTIVVLELCSSRRNILSLDEETVLKEVSDMNFQKIRLALSNSGTVQGTLHLLLLSMSAQLTRKLGMAPGGEFRAAMREARKIPGCVLLLGDRPFNITITRALAALSFFQKMKLAWQFITCNEDITREEIEKCKEKDLLERMLTEMTGEFPSITEVFVNERDVYLAHSLHLAATSDAHRSNGGPIVGVVGMGHVPGIVRNWGQTTDEDVSEIIRIPETPLSTIILRKTLKMVVYSAVAYGVYRVGSKVFKGANIPNVLVRGSRSIKHIVANKQYY